jgi:hypothetical protein
MLIAQTNVASDEQLLISWVRAELRVAQQRYGSARCAE